ncbi:MAG: HAD-IC family P-type ATPase, partial [Oscillospiraceae bacterium]|nr:HAD-IC family P-type ATPase [Oscillospiraceae bacterium]
MKYWYNVSISRKRGTTVISGSAYNGGIKRLNPDPEHGLTAEQARERREAGAVNTQPLNMTPTVGRIIAKNSLTLFNIVNLLLAIAVILVGRPEQTLFIGVVLCNTVMGIFQELRAKKTLDKLAILSQSAVTAVRDGGMKTIRPEDIVLDDIVYLKSGNQICADAEVVRSIGLTVDESLLTGESDRISKDAGDEVMSGTYVVGGQAYVRVSAVGQANYATRLTSEAKKSRGKHSKLLRFLRVMIRILTIVIVPLGIMLFYTTYKSGVSLEESVVSTAAAMVSMIPEGLVLLSGVTLMLGAVRLSGRKALVQSLPGIETLARVDVLCLDKTGTITDGAMSFERLELQGGAAKRDVERALSELMGNLRDDNATAKALRAKFGETRLWRVTSVVPFTSERKWSAVSFEDTGSYFLGAPQSLLSASDAQSLSLAGIYAEQGYRVLCLAHSDSALKGGALPKRVRCDALILISDGIRDTARDTFAYFEREGVTLKVISGDDMRSVSAVAAKAGIANAYEAVDMSQYTDKTDYSALAERYTVFGRTTPQQKRMLIRAMQKNGHTACMTGDGVNDILAMREAHCSVAMIGGSDAARGSCDFVLMTSDFSAMIGVLKEGRRVINN